MTSQFNSDLCITRDLGAPDCVSQKTIGRPSDTLLTRFNESICNFIRSSSQHNLDENLFVAPISLFSAEEIAHKLRYRLRLPQQRQPRAKLFHHRGKQSHEPRGQLYYCLKGATQRDDLRIGRISLTRCYPDRTESSYCRNRSVTSTTARLGGQAQNDDCGSSALGLPEIQLKTTRNVLTPAYVSDTWLLHLLGSRTALNALALTQLSSIGVSPTVVPPPTRRLP